MKKLIALARAVNSLTEVLPTLDLVNVMQIIVRSLPDTDIQELQHEADFLVSVLADISQGRKA